MFLSLSLVSFLSVEENQDTKTNLASHQEPIVDYAQESSKLKLSLFSKHVSWERLCVIVDEGAARAN